GSRGWRGERDREIRRRRRDVLHERGLEDIDLVIGGKGTGNRSHCDTILPPPHNLTEAGRVTRSAEVVDGNAAEKNEGRLIEDIHDSAAGERRHRHKRSTES